MLLLEACCRKHIRQNGAVFVRGPWAGIVQRFWPPIPKVHITERNLSAAARQYHNDSMNAHAKTHEGLEDLKKIIADEHFRESVNKLQESVNKVHEKMDAKFPGRGKKREMIVAFLPCHDGDRFKNTNGFYERCSKDVSVADPERFLKVILEDEPNSDGTRIVKFESGDKDKLTADQIQSLKIQSHAGGGRGDEKDR